MTKRSTAANRGRRSRKSAVKPKRAPVVTANDAGNISGISTGDRTVTVAAPAAPNMTPEQLLPILNQQVGIARNAFFRLASVRAADLVKFEGKSWDDGAAYINAEMQGLDQQLATAVPQPQGQG